MGWRQQIDQVQEQLFAFDRDLKQLDDLLWQFKIDATRLNLPDPVKAFLSGSIGDLDWAVKELRRLFDMLFLPVVEPEIAHGFLDYLKGVHAGHQSIMECFDPMAAAFIENYQPPDAHAQYHKSLPNARADMQSTDALLAQQIKNLDALLSSSEDLTALLAALLTGLLVIAVAVAGLVATALLSAPVSGPAVVAGVGDGVVTAGAVGAAEATALADIGAVIGVEIPSLTWMLAAGAALTLAVVETSVVERSGLPKINVPSSPDPWPGPPELWKLLLIAAGISIPAALGILAYVLAQNQSNGDNSQSDIAYPPGITTDAEKRLYKELLAKYGDSLLAAELAKAALTPDEADELIARYGLDAVRAIAHNPNFGGSSTIRDMWSSRNIPGITKVVEDLLTSGNNSNAAPAALYELWWIANHTGSIAQVQAPGYYYNDQGNLIEVKGPDAILNDPAQTIVQLKNYTWGNPFLDKKNAEAIAQQAIFTHKPQNYPGRPIKFIFNGKNGPLPQVVIDTLNELAANGVSWEYWPPLGQ